MDAPMMPVGLDTSAIRSLSGTTYEVPAGASPAETAEKFEAMLATMLVKEMRRAVPEGFFGEGAAGDIYSGWLDEHVGQTLAGHDALHVREMIEKSVIQKIEAQQ
ncbi:MAG: rod-binding protein [Planctomycetota bacterium]|nr:rod-binding protein [Planctomycetota bacterium]